MAANIDPIFIAAPNVAEVTFVNADGTTPKDLVLGATNGTKVFSINATSDDTSDVVVSVFIYDGSTAYLLGAVNVPTLSGTNGTDPSVNLLESSMILSVDADGELFIPSGYKVQVAPQAAVTTAKTLTIICFAGDY